MSTGTPENDLRRLAVGIVTAHISRNSVAAQDLSKVIQSVYAALSTPENPVTAARPEPAVPINKSVFPDYIVCLEDGKKLKMLKRHLQTAYGMTPDEYRARWGLPASYPMVTPNYATQRSTLAKAFGLGRTSAPSAPLSVKPEVVVQKIPERKRGRKRGMISRATTVSIA